jgi:hypothetical protein
MSLPSFGMSVAAGTVDNASNNPDAYFAPMWFLKAEAAHEALRLAKLPSERAAEEEIAKPITTSGIGRMRRSRK